MNAAKDSVVRLGSGLFTMFRRMREDPLDLLTEAGRAGDVVYLGATPGKSFYLVNHPEHIETLLGAPEVVLNRASLVKLVFGKSSFILEGDAWLERRRVLLPAYRLSLNPQYGEIIHSAIEELFERWDGYAARGEEFDLATELLGASRDVIVRAMFGKRLAEPAAALRELFDAGMRFRHAHRWKVFNLPLLFPSKAHREFNRNRARLEGIVRELLEADGNGAATFLGAMRKHIGREMTLEDARDEVTTMFAVGHLTTGAALTWTACELARHAAAADACASEVRQVSAEGMPSVADLPRLAYTSRIIQESVRLHPPVWSISRRLRQPTRIGNALLPRGAVAIFCQFVLHRRPDVWDEPERFDPERFASDAGPQRHRLAYMPFGSGSRQCLGRELAGAELLSIVSALAARYRLTLSDRSDLRPVALSTLMPRAAWARASRRSM